MKGVFEINLGSGYDDEIALRYHFPAKRDFLRIAEELVGDWGHLSGDTTKRR